MYTQTYTANDDWLKCLKQNNRTSIITIKYPQWPYSAEIANFIKMIIDIFLLVTLLNESHKSMSFHCIDPIRFDGDTLIRLIPDSLLLRNYFCEILCYHLCPI